MTPILDLSLMRIKTFQVSLIAGSLSRITQGAQPFLLPLMMQLAFGLSAAQSGVLTFATACGSMMMKGTAAPILRRFGFRRTLIWNGVFSSLLYALCAAFRAAWPHWALFAVLAVCGFSMSLQFTAYNTVAYDDVPAERTAAANSFFTTFQQLALSFGICTGALALTMAKTISGHTHAGVGDFSAAFLVVTAISLLAAPVCLGYPRNAGSEMSGHRHKSEEIEVEAASTQSALTASRLRQAQADHLVGIGRQLRGQHAIGHRRVRAFLRRHAQRRVAGVSGLQIGARHHLMVDDRRSAEAA